MGDDLGAAIDAAAATYGIDLTGEEREGYVAEAGTTAELLAALESTDFASEPATGVEPGEDAYNAFLYRCDCPGPAGADDAVAAAVEDSG